MFHMKETNFFLGILILTALSALQVAAKSSKSSEEKFEYECANKFSRYRLDNAPAEYGISAGYYATGKKAYIGLSFLGNMGYQITRLQLDPPGIRTFLIAGPGSFSNDSNVIWYLRYSHHHKYEWVDSSGGKKEPFAIEIGAAEVGFGIFAGRMKKNGFIMVGTVAPPPGIFNYADENGIGRSTKTGYQVLTCRSNRNETQIPPPPLPVSPVPNIDLPIGCVHNWIRYNNDDAPAKNGISAGTYDCGNEAYIGKRKGFGIFAPGRIQIVSPAGYFATRGGIEELVTNGSFYLADNPRYTYRWVNFAGAMPMNTVLVRNDVGNFVVPITRVNLNGHMKIGKLVFPVALTLDENGVEQNHANFEFLVCDPWPKFQCGQQWKKFNVSDSSSGPAIDGFSVDSIYIGRGTRKCINGCDYGLGRAQVTPASAAGVYYLDDLTATEVFDTTTAEYLVKNPNNTYKWQPSRNGEKVANALELHKEGHRPFYIGVTRINDNVFIGKVRPGEGLFFVDINGKQKSTSAYDVLTCFSPEADNGIYQEESDSNWFGSFGCPVRKSWSFTQWRCVCRDEFKGIFVSSGAKWSDETCSYIVA